MNIKEYFTALEIIIGPVTMESNKSSSENTATMTTNHSSANKVLEAVAVLRYTAALGPITGRPDLPPFTFRLFEVVIRKHHRCFWVEFKPNEPTSSIDVHLSYHPNIGNIRRALGGLTELIHVRLLSVLFLFFILFILNGLFSFKD